MENRDADVERCRNNIRGNPVSPTHPGSHHVGTLKGGPYGQLVKVAWNQIWHIPIMSMEKWWNNQSHQPLFLLVDLPILPHNYLTIKPSLLMSFLYQFLDGNGVWRCVVKSQGWLMSKNVRFIHILILVDGIQVFPRLAAVQITGVDVVNASRWHQVIALEDVSGNGDGSHGWSSESPWPVLGNLPETKMLGTIWTNRPTDGKSPYSNKISKSP